MVAVPDEGRRRCKVLMLSIKQMLRWPDQSRLGSQIGASAHARSLPFTVYAPRKKEQRQQNQPFYSKVARAL